MEELQHVLPTVIFIPGFVPEAQNPQVLALLMYTENTDLDTFALNSKKTETIRKSKFFLRSRGGGNKENLSLDILLVEM